MRALLLVVGLPFAAPAVAQTVIPPFDTSLQLVTVGWALGFNHGGCAFAPNDPNTLLIAPDGTGAFRALPLVRNGLGQITGTGTSVQVATLGNNDSGLSVGPGNVLFASCPCPNRMSQVKPASTQPDRVDDLGPLGVY